MDRSLTTPRRIGSSHAVDSRLCANTVRGTGQLGRGANEAFVSRRAEFVNAAEPVDSRRGRGCRIRKARLLGGVFAHQSIDRLTNEIGVSRVAGVLLNEVDENAA